MNPRQVCQEAKNAREHCISALSVPESEYNRENGREWAGMTLGWLPVSCFLLTIPLFAGRIFFRDPYSLRGGEDEGCRPDAPGCRPRE